MYRDVDYAELSLVVELDGRLFHSSTRARDKDMERDLDAAVAGTTMTLRLGFGQVHQRPCSTASKLALVMRHLGWTGQTTTCSSCRVAA